MLIKFERFVYVASDWSVNVATALLLFVFVASIVDIAGAKSLSLPIPGIIEITSSFQGMYIALSMAMTYLIRQHISVELFTDRLPKKAQAAISVAVSLFLAGLFAVVVWQMLKLGINFQQKSQYSITIRLPLPFFVYIMTAALIIPCLAFLLDLFKSIKKLVTG